MKPMPTLLTLGLIVLWGHLAEWAFKKFRVPDVLILMLTGILIGPYGFEVINKEDFGIVGPALTQLALVVILFTGGLGISFQMLAQSLKGSSAIALVSFMASSAIGTLLALPFLPNLPSALAFGFILGGTSSAVVIPMSQILPLKDKTRTVLLLESALTDVLCIVLCFALFAGLASGQEFNLGLVTGELLRIFLLSILSGAFAGFFWAWFLRLIRNFPNTLFSSITFVLIVAGFVEWIGLNGGLAVLSLGFVVANAASIPFHRVPYMEKAHMTQVLDFESRLFNEAVFLLKIFFFIYLGMSFDFRNTELLLLGAVITLAIYFVRVPITKFCLSKDHGTYDASITSLMAPKGLAAAVLAGLPVQMGLEGGEWMQSTANAVILMSILLTSILAPLVKWPPLHALYSKVFPWIDSTETKLSSEPSQP